MLNFHIYGNIIVVEVNIMEENKQKIETMRVGFLNYFKKLKIINYICFFISIIGFVLDFVLLKDKSTIAIVIAIVIIILMFVYLKIIKSKLNKHTQQYIRDCYQVLSNIELSEVDVKNVTSLADDIFAIDDIKNAKFMLNVESCKSKNTLQFDAYDKTIQMADLMFTVPNPKDTKKPIVAFCGKFIQYHSLKTYEERIVLYRKTVVPNCYGPTDVEGLEKVIDDDKLLVYAANKNYTKILNKKILETLANVEIDDYLYDLTITINGNLVTVALSYADKLVAIPLNEPTDFVGFERVAKDIKLVVDEIIKNI